MRASMPVEVVRVPQHLIAMPAEPNSGRHRQAEAPRVVASAEERPGEHHPVPRGDSQAANSQHVEFSLRDRRRVAIGCRGPSARLECLIRQHVEEPVPHTTIAERIEVVLADVRGRHRIAPAMSINGGAGVVMRLRSRGLPRVDPGNSHGPSTGLDGRTAPVPDVRPSVPDELAADPARTVTSSWSRNPRHRPLRGGSADLDPATGVRNWGTP
jgi:hypothetical protein